MAVSRLGESIFEEDYGSHVAFEGLRPVTLMKSNDLRLYEYRTQAGSCSVNEGGDSAHGMEASEPPVCV